LAGKRPSPRPVPRGALAWLGRFAVRHPRPILTAAGLSLLKVQVGGAAIVNLEASNQIKHDLVKAESIALLLTLLLLVLAFRGLIAALLPLIIGVVAIVGTLLLLRGLASVTSRRLRCPAR
jgi:predicted RND superfamily exporter protein